MPLKLGTTNIDIPFSKAYLGSVLVYKKGPTYIDTEFTTCPFPTTWNEITANLNYSATNDYGTWEILADSCYNDDNDYACTNAFDGKTGNSWRPESLDNDSAYGTLEIISPVLIKPSLIFTKYQYQSNTTNLSKIQAYNEQISMWEDLKSLERTGNTSIELNIENPTDNFYHKFRILSYRYSSTNRVPRINEFQITAGIIRTEV